MVPKCLAIIPDGNRRYAQANGLPAVEGHRRGLHNAREITRVAFECGVEHVVFWGASESNLNERSVEEKTNIFKLLKLELRQRLFRTEKVRFRLRGAWQEHATDSAIAEMARLVEERTAKYHEHQLTLLFGYDGERDIEQAVQKLHELQVRPTRQLIREHLWTAHLPDVDMLIRTGVDGDPHDSDAFLPLQRRNAQLVFSSLRWPDFEAEHLDAAFNDFAGRERRMGA